MARDKEINGVVYGLKGAVCSVLFVIPLLFVIGRLHGVKIPLVFIALAYSFVYTLWAGLIFSANVLGPLPEGWFGKPDNYPYELLFTWGIPLVLFSLVPPLVSVIRHSIRRSSGREVAEWPYVVPFALAYAYWFAISLPLDWPWSWLRVLDFIPT